MKVREIDYNELNEVIKHDKVLVDCYASWCGPCRMLSPIIDSVALENDDCLFYKIDIDSNPKVSEEYEIMSIPMLLYFEKGKLVNKSIGLISKEDVKKIIK